MSDTTTKPVSVAARIAEYMARTDEPRSTTRGKKASPDDNILGEVPMSLRHLCNLHEDLQKEEAAAERSYLAAREATSTVHKMLFDAIQTEVCDFEGFDEVGITADWKVIGLESDFPKGLGDLLGMLLGGKDGEGLEGRLEEAIFGKRPARQREDAAAA
jgi:hypothetical protein